MTSAHTPLNMLAALALSAAALPCAAQLRLDVMPDAALPLLSTQQRPLSGGSGLTLPVARAQNFYETSASDSSWLGSAIQLEAPRATSTGQYTRPKFHVGVPSDSMRGFLNSAGFSAEKCQLPMVRARTKSSGDGDLNGTVWLYARCTFR